MEGRARAFPLIPCHTASIFRHPAQRLNRQPEHRRDTCMDEMMGRARFLGRAAVLGAATFATLLAVGTAGVAEAAQTPTASAPTPASSTAHVTHESFILPAGQD